MASFKFSDIQKAADEKFSDFVVIAPAEEGVEGSTEELTFKHVLREDHEKRVALKASLDPKTHKGNPEIKGLDQIDGQVFLLKQAFRTVAATPRDAERLEQVVLEANGERGQLGTWQELFAEYAAHTQLGEA